VTGGAARAGPPDFSPEPRLSLRCLPLRCLSLRFGFAPGLANLSCELRLQICAAVAGTPVFAVNNPQSGCDHDVRTGGVRDAPYRLRKIA
jgi:hypothetical protein